LTIANEKKVKSPAKVTKDTKQAKLGGVRGQRHANGGDLLARVAAMLIND
jgi:hypothetical protein